MGDMDVITHKENIIKLVVPPQIISGAWIAYDHKDTEYDPENPYQGIDGTSLKSEKAVIGDQVIIRVKTKKIPSSVKNISTKIIDKDLLFHEELHDNVVLNRVKKDGKMTDIFETELILGNEKYETAWNAWLGDILFEGEEIELKFIVTINYEIESETYNLEKEIDEILKVKKPYFEEGFWTEKDDKTKKINKAVIGETIGLYIKSKGFTGKEIEIKFFEKDGLLNPDDSLDSVNATVDKDEVFFKVEIIDDPDSPELSGDAKNGIKLNLATAGDEEKYNLYVKAVGKFYEDSIEKELPEESNDYVSVEPIKIKTKQDTYTVVLDNTGNVTVAYPLLEFEIEDGPPDFFIDIQVARNNKDLLEGGKGFDGAAWLNAPGGHDQLWEKRDPAKPIKTDDELLEQRAFSSWSNGENNIKLDANGKAIYSVPLEWWQDLARMRLDDFKGDEENIYYRVLAFKDAGSPVVVRSIRDANSGSAPKSEVINNLDDFEVIDLGYQQGGGQYRKSIRMEFTVKESNTTEMYTMVQWMQGGFPMWTGPGVAPDYPNHQLYNIIHEANFPDRTVDRLHLDPRYWDGIYNISVDGKTAHATDEPGMGFPAGYTHVFIHLDFETYVHLNFEVPVAVTIIRQDGGPPVYGVVTGVIPDPAAVPPGEIHELHEDTWEVRILLEKNAAGVVSVSHPANFAGP